MRVMGEEKKAATKKILLNCKKNGTGNTWKHMGMSGPSLPESGIEVQISDAQTTEWQAPESKTYAIRRSGGIDTGYVGSLKIWLRSGDGGFVEYGSYWMGTETGQLDWQSLVKGDLQIPA